MNQDEFDKMLWKGTFTLFYKVQHRIVKTLANIPITEHIHLESLRKANEYVYELRMNLRGLQKRLRQEKGRNKRIKHLLDEERKSERYWRNLANIEEGTIPPDFFLVPSKQSEEKQDDTE